MRIGLALSGGGFRATLYHLGLVRYLYDAGILPQVTHITAVSGGSIIAAHLVLNWDRYNGSASEFDSVAGELLDFVRLDVRNRILRRYGLGFAIRGPRRLLGLSNRILSRTGLLEYHYEKYLYGDTSLFQLPENPRLHLLATNLSEGRLCSFQRDGLLMIGRGAGDDFRIDHFRIGLGTVPMAVAASSAFPGFFPPMELTGADVGARSGEFGRQAYTDGGVFDNLGIRMFRFLALSAETEQPPWDGVLVSDVGKPFEIQNNRRGAGLIRTAMRASDILMDRVWQLENETFKDAPGFVFAKITEVIQPEQDPTALHPEIQRRLPSIRTDLDRFSNLEISCLIRQGYCVARKTCQSRPELFGTATPQESPAGSVFAPPARASVATERRERAWHEPIEVTRDARTLYASAIRRIWSTLLDYRDWASWVYVPLIIPLLFVLPYAIFKTYQRSQAVSQIIESLAQGSRDLEQMTRLIEGPVEPWTGENAEDLAAGDKTDLSGYLVLQDSLIVDLRSWNASAARDDATSFLYAYRRLKVRKRREAESFQPFRVNVLAVSPATQFRFPAQQLKPKLYSRAIESAVPGERLTHWEVGADFTRVPAGESADLIYEYRSPGLFLRDGVGSTTLAFEVQGETVELTRWLLLPRGQQYRSFQVIRYETGKPESAEKVNPVTEYLANDYTVLAFKLLALKAGQTYEITWFHR